jgi:hypothetical protein
MQVSCKQCATKSQIGSIIFCLFLGWWGFPFGLIVTPVQIIRNLIAMIGGADASTPSQLFEKIIRVQLAARTLAPQAAQRSVG